ncbi:MAG: MSHA pilin protein MshA [Cognaticolwellia sp.]|jgi:MSHA pilin protein MshA
MKKLTNSSFSKQKGFTLIELVVVIVILGILAATAVPKFIDLTTDARESVMKGVQGSINSAVNLAHAKALVEGSLTEIKIGSKYYALVNGFPAAGALGDGAAEGDGLGIDSLIELESGTRINFDETVVPASTDPITNVVTPASSTWAFTHLDAEVSEECSLSYANAADQETPPVITHNFDKC